MGRRAGLALFLFCVFVRKRPSGAGSMAALREGRSSPARRQTPQSPCFVLASALATALTWNVCKCVHFMCDTQILLIFVDKNTNRAPRRSWIHAIAAVGGLHAQDLRKPCGSPRELSVSHNWPCATWDKE